MSENLVTTNSAAKSQAVWWVIAVSLAVIACCMVQRAGETTLPAAWAQPTTQAGARGVFAFSGQLNTNTFGVFMVDLDAMTLWCYEILPDKRSLRLVSGRTWKYDRYLKNHQCEEPSWSEIERLVQEERDLELQKR